MRRFGFIAVLTLALAVCYPYDREVHERCGAGAGGQGEAECTGHEDVASDGQLGGDLEPDPDSELEDSPVVDETDADAEEACTGQTWELGDPLADPPCGQVGVAAGCVLEDFLAGDAPEWREVEPVIDVECESIDCSEVYRAMRISEGGGGVAWRVSVLDSGRVAVWNAGASFSLWEPSGQLVTALKFDGRVDFVADVQGGSPDFVVFTSDPGLAYDYLDGRVIAFERNGEMRWSRRFGRAGVSAVLGPDGATLFFPVRSWIPERWRGIVAVRVLDGAVEGCTTIPSFEFDVNSGSTSVLGVSPVGMSAVHLFGEAWIADFGGAVTTVALDGGHGGTGLEDFANAPIRTPSGTWVGRHGARLIEYDGSEVIRMVELPSGLGAHQRPLMGSADTRWWAVRSGRLSAYTAEFERVSGLWDDWAVHAGPVLFDDGLVLAGEGFGFVLANDTEVVARISGDVRDCSDPAVGDGFLVIPCDDTLTFLTWPWQPAEGAYRVGYDSRWSFGPRTSDP